MADEKNETGIGTVENKFLIPSISSTRNKTVRFPKDIVESVQNTIQNKNCTFSAFVVAAVRMALEHIDEQS